jgi:glycosyltransferase involved in cell wall biosynthesis
MPRYSIVVPTVDRPDILRESLAATLSLPRTDIEILVSDNFSDSPTQAVIDAFTDPRLRKFRTAYRMPMPDHWNWIWNKTTGDYVIYTGDDSTLTENALRAADVAIGKYGADVVSWRSVLYYHPDWNVKFRHLPDRGNILSLNMGFSKGLYRVHTEGVIRHFCENLRLSGCFPSVVGFLVRRELGDTITRETGKLHWAPCPDIAASLLALTRAGEGRYYFWDGVGGIGGWSGNSNTGGLLSRGRKSKRLKEYMAEFRSPEERLPNHDIKLETISNFLAASISQARHAYPDRFPNCFFDVKTIAKRSIDDAYRELTVPWADDETFIAQLDALIDSLNVADRAELREYLAAAKSELTDYIEGRKEHYNPTPHGASNFLDLMRAIGSDPVGRYWRLFLRTRCNPANKYWEYAGTTFIDMQLFGASTIRGVAGSLPSILEEFETKQISFPAQYKALGILGSPPLEILDY